MNVVQKLTPYMSSYSEEFSDSGNVNWLPYVMYFHPFNYKSAVVNTDASGFRFSDFGGRSVSVGSCGDLSEVSILAGSSTVFGIGASSDSFTLSSCLTKHDDSGQCWLNFGGRSYNSTQEMILFSLYRSNLPRVGRIILFSGFNDLGLARLPSRLRGEHGAFFMCNDFYGSMKKTRQSAFSRWASGRIFSEKSSDEVPDLKDQLEFAASVTLRNLSNWKAFAQDMCADLMFVLQPLSNWVRDKGSEEEELIFAELEKRGRFVETYGDILSQAVYVEYRNKLSAGAQSMGVKFLDMTSLLKDSIAPKDWVYVDRIHFTDYGHEVVSKILLQNILSH